MLEENLQGQTNDTSIVKDICTNSTVNTIMKGEMLSSFPLS